MGEVDALRARVGDLEAGAKGVNKRSLVDDVGGESNKKTKVSERIGPTCHVDYMPPILCRVASLNEFLQDQCNVHIVS